jgi:hypothetical protein
MYANAQYVKNPAGEIDTIRCDINGVTSFVPIDDANVDYISIMALVAEGMLTIEPAESK